VMFSELEGGARSRGRQINLDSVSLREITHFGWVEEKWGMVGVRVVQGCSRLVAIELDLPIYSISSERTIR
jgi:hypothetical protein